MNKILDSIFNRNNFFFFILLLFCGGFYPFIHSYLLWGNYRWFVSLFLLLLLIIGVHFNKYHKKIVPPCKPFSIIWLIWSIFSLVHSLIFNNDLFSIMFLNVTTYVFLIIVLNIFPSIYFLRTFISFNILMGISAIIGFFLVVVGKLSPISYYEPWQNFGFFFAKAPDWSYEFIRPSGWYDEPGSFAFIAMLLLLINKKHFNSPLIEYCLLLIPIITSSLAHFITIFAYVILFKLNRLSSIIGIIVISLCFVFLVNINTNNNILTIFKNNTVGRITSTMEGGVSSDASRSSAYTLGPKIFEKHLWGGNIQEVANSFPNRQYESFWFPLAVYGIIGIFFYLLPFIYIFFKSFNSSGINFLNIKFLILIFLNLAQRPSWDYTIYVVLLYFIFFYSPSCKEINTI